MKILPTKLRDNGGSLFSIFFSLGGAFGQFVIYDIVLWNFKVAIIIFISVFGISIFVISHLPKNENSELDAELELEEKNVSSETESEEELCELKEN